jgi:hypothetical protein
MVACSRLAAATLVFIAACHPRGAGTHPGAPDPSSVEAPWSEDPPSEAPVPELPWVLRFVALPDSEFMLDAIDEKPWLLWESIELDMELDDPYRVGSIRVEESIHVPIEELAHRGPQLEAPPSTVWLLGPEGACAADVASDTARLELHESGMTEVTVSFALTGCEGTTWAPFAIVSGRPPPDLSWSPAQTLTADEPVLFALRETYVAKLRDMGVSSPRVELRSAPATRPQVLEVLYGAGSDCTGFLHNALGVYSEDGFEPWSCGVLGTNCGLYELLGTVGTPQQAHLAVFVDHNYSLVIRSLADDDHYGPAPGDDFVTIPSIDGPMEGKREHSFPGIYPCEDDDGL